tara:strand:- start:210 stop:608 length:399 start_codon:yes stop_codon:yes gene_type:complete
MKEEEQSILDKYSDLPKAAFAKIKKLFIKFKKEMERLQKAGKTEESKQKFAEFMKENNANFADGFEAGKKSKTKLKSKGPSQGDIMGGAKGPKGPLGGELDKKKNKNKKSMMKKSSYDPRKANRAGQKMGQR